jgi:hypothetical protein
MSTLARCDYCGQETQGVESVMAKSPDRRKYARERAFEERVREVVSRRQGRHVVIPKLCSTCYGRFERGEVT